MVYSLKNKFSNKIEEMHHMIVVKQTPINKIMCDTLLSQLASPDCHSFFFNKKMENFDENTDGMDLANKIYFSMKMEKYVDVNEIKNKLLECACSDVPNTLNHNLFVITVNKICSENLYNKNVIKECNNNFESLLHFLTIDPQLIKVVNSKDEKFYIKLLNFLNTSDVTKVFKYMDNKNKTLPVMKCALKCDYNCIKYIGDVFDENLCDIAMALGHSNLQDIDKKYHSESICRKYVDLDINNLKYVTRYSNVSESFFIEMIDRDIDNVKLISDSFCFGVNLMTHVVKKDGLFIKYIPPERQTLRLMELAMEQNKLAKYYVTYKCFPETNITEIKKLVLNSFNLIKKFKELKELDNLGEFEKFIHQCSDKFETTLNLQSGIIFYEKYFNCDCYVMTAENYLNYQYRLYLERKYNFNIDVIDSKAIFSQKFSDEDPSVINELAVSFVDSNKNTYVVFFEIV